MAREILNHHKNDGLLSEEFAYPLKAGLGYDAITLAKETFAQAWHAYLDAQKRADIEIYLPKTAQYLSEVLKHAQDTTTEIHSPSKSDTVQLRKSFGQRSERTGDTSAAGSRESVRSAEQANPGTEKTTSSATSKPAESSLRRDDGTSESFSRQADGIDRQDGQDTSTEIHRPSESTAQQIRSNFAQRRGSENGDAVSAGLREGSKTDIESTDAGTTPTDFSGTAREKTRIAGSDVGPAEYSRAASDTSEVKALSIQDGGPGSSEPKSLASRYVTPEERNQQALRPRTQPEQQANDALLHTVLNDIILPHLEQHGIDSNIPGMARVTEYQTEPMKVREKGQVVLDEQADGRDTYRIIIASHLMETGKLADIVRAIRHEQGHAIDMALNGGIYSSQPEMGFRRDAKSDQLHATGPVASEILNHYRKGGILAEEFSYPLHDTLHFDPRGTASEVFAQAWHLYQNEKTRVMLEAEFPHTVKFLNEVIEHVKESSTTVHGPTKSDTQQLADSFRKRFVSRWENSDAYATGGRRTHGKNRNDDGRSDQADDGAAGFRTSGFHGRNRGRNPKKLYSQSVFASDTSPAERIAVAERYIKKLPASVQAPVRSVTELA